MSEKTFEQEEAKRFEDKERATELTKEDEYLEEAAAEMAPRVGTFTEVPSVSPENERPTAEESPRHIEEETATGGRGMGMVALILSILSLFMLPVLLGAAGLIVGFIARRRGASGLGNWAIGIGAISLIVSLFITPFFF